MPLLDGDPANPFDVWTRVLTSDQWRKDGRLNNGAFSGKSFLQTAAQGRHWAQEVSGRLLSLVQNLREESETFCRTFGCEFHGVMFQTVENLRSDGAGYPKHGFFPTEVCYTPVNTPARQDQAHADLVTSKVTDESNKEVRDWLQDIIQAVKPDKLPAVCSMRQSPNFPNN
jgi:hypothetical protein